METTKGIMTAIFNVQQGAIAIRKTSTGQVGSKQYKYANLNDTWDSVKQLLKDNNLAVYASPVAQLNNNVSGTYFKTTLFHTESGEMLTETMNMILTRQDPQAIGAAITYYRRYMLQSMLGLIPDDDNDAREHRTATVEQKRKIVGAVKQTFPEATTPELINTTLQNILGKHPSMILEDEADGAVDLIKAYKEDK